MIKRVLRALDYIGDLDDRYYYKEDVLDRCNYFVRDLIEDVSDTRLITPLSKKNHVGVEIEFISKSEYFDIAFDIRDSGLENKVVLGFDCSINSLQQGEGYEVKVIDEESSINNTLKQVLLILRDHKAYTNESCGLHVHIDTRNRDVNKVFHNFLYAQDLLYKLSSDDRKYSTYCRKQDLNNICTYSSHSYGIEISEIDTIEIRMQDATLDLKLISNWIKLLITIAKKRVLYDKKDLSPEKLIKITNFKVETKEFIKEREFD